MSKKRESNIELLRIFSMLGVIVLHYNNNGGGLQYVTKYSANYFVLIIMESLTICAVDLFMLISGYFSCKNKKTLIEKPIKLLTQVIIFSFGHYLIASFINGTLSIKGTIASIVPANYFVILYIVVYLLSPYLNLIYDTVSDNFIILIVSVFSVYPTLVDWFSKFTGKNWFGLSSIGLNGSQEGYQIVNFIMMYYVGMYINKNIDKLKNISIVKLIMLVIATTLIISLMANGFEILGIGMNTAWSYCNPFIVVEAVLIFLIFNKINIGSKRYINKISAASFTVYLTHCYLIQYIGVEWAIQQNTIIMLLHLYISVIAIYLVCFIVYLIYSYLAKFVTDRLKHKETVITKL